eukprot:1026368-Pelagomonas_calceolata.AAC.6
MAYDVFSPALTNAFKPYEAIRNSGLHIEGPNVLWNDTYAFTAGCVVMFLFVRVSCREKSKLEKVCKEQPGCVQSPIWFIPSLFWLEPLLICRQVAVPKIKGKPKNWSSWLSMCSHKLWHASLPTRCQEGQGWRCMPVQVAVHIRTYVYITNTYYYTYMEHFCQHPLLARVYFACSHILIKINGRVLFLAFCAEMPWVATRTNSHRPMFSNSSFCRYPIFFPDTDEDQDWGHPGWDQSYKLWASRATDKNTKTNIQTRLIRQCPFRIKT